MSWKKYFQEVPNAQKIERWMERQGSNGVSSSKQHFQSWLPEVYSGPSNRIERYQQYEMMNRDPVISTSLDTISEFCTQKEEKSKNYFEFNFNDESSESETQILKEKLQEWTELNDFDKRLWRMFRNILLYGDQFFVRDPETYKWLWVDPFNVEKVVVNEAAGKKPEEYWITNADLNLQTLTITISSTLGHNHGYPAAYASPNPKVGPHGMDRVSGNVQALSNNSLGIDAAHMVHFSLSEGLDNNWPFGTSILEPVFKTFKQKELLEDAILIYRVHRAPERRVFYIDVGNMPANKAMAHIERVKNEINQRRIPTRTGGNQNIIDTTFNPLSMTEDFFFPQCLSFDTKIDLLDGRSLTLNEVIQEYKNGKENYVYSVDQDTHEIEVGKISWAGPTRKNADLIKVTLDNDEEIVCTPDHKFVMRDGSEKEAKDLYENDSLMPLYLKDGKTSNYQADKKYKRYICNKDGKVKWVHTMVCPKTKPGKETEIHHIDFNSLNNNPTNLIEMNTKEHRELHRENASKNMKNRWKNKESREILINGIRNLYKNANEEFMEKIIERNKQNGKKGWNKKSKDSRRKHLNQLALARKKGNFNNSISFNENVWNRFKELSIPLIQENLNLFQLVDQLKNDSILINELRKANHNRTIRKRISSNSINNIFVRKICIWADYKGYNEFKDQYIDKEKYSKFLKSRIRTDHLKVMNQRKYLERLEKYNENPKSCKNCNTDFEYNKRHLTFCSYSCASTYNNLAGKIGVKSRRVKNEFYNHKVVSVEFLNHKEDTGCITVDSQSHSHNFALSSGIFVKNSFDGRGSRVETLPGGEGLGQIDDLDYFDNKLKKGLNIPTSYISGTSGEESQTYNDGRATVALISEHRFQKYCERLQSLVNDVFDREFKLYLKADGVNIDSSLFQLTLNVPQNFAKYRQIELDNALISTWGQISEARYISKRFAMKRWLGMTEDEIVENEKMWKEENPDSVRKSGSVQDFDSSDDLRSFGIRPEGGDDMDLDMDDFGDDELGGEDSPISGDETSPDESPAGPGGGPDELT